MKEETKKRNKSLIIEGQKYYTQFTKKFENRKVWEKPNPKLIKSVLPGNVVKVFAEENKKYRKGEVLLIFKAMKMDNSLLMPFSGEIKKVYVNEGDVLKKDQLLVEIK